jgi:hypothetical protein
MENNIYSVTMKIGDRVHTPYGPGTIVAEESNRIEFRYGVDMDDANGVPFLHDDIDERYINDKPVFFFKSELKKNQK